MHYILLVPTSPHPPTLPPLSSHTSHPSPCLLKFCPYVLSGQFIGAIHIQTDVIWLCVCVCMCVCACGMCMCVCVCVCACACVCACVCVCVHVCVCVCMCMCVCMWYVHVCVCVCEHMEVGRYEKVWSKHAEIWQGFSSSINTH